MQLQLQEQEQITKEQQKQIEQLQEQIKLQELEQEQIKQEKLLQSLNVPRRTAREINKNYERTVHNWMGWKGYSRYAASYKTGWCTA